MLILSHLLNSISVILNILFQTLIILVTVRVVLSWVNPDPYNPIVRFIVSVTDPMFALLNPIRKYIGNIGGRIDLVPLIFVLILIFMQSFLVGLLRDLSLELYRGSFG